MELWRKKSGRGEREIDRVHVYDIYIYVQIGKKKRGGELEIQEKRNRIYSYGCSRCYTVEQVVYRPIYNGVYI